MFRPTSRYSPCQLMWLIVATAALSLLCSSCGSAKTQKKTYPVEGKVFWKNDKTPATHAVVVFHPSGDASPETWPDGFPRGTVGADGVFKLTSFAPDDGAPAGDYAVLIQWPRKSAANDEEETSDEDEEDRFEGMLSDPTAPRWRKQVKEGDNDPKDFILIIK